MAPESFEASKTAQVIVGRRYFNVAQAERAIVLVRRIVADIVRAYGRLLELQEMMETAETAAPGLQRLDEVRSQIAAAAERLHSYLVELDDLGVELRNWEVGVVDFPCIAGGREVRLCWQYGDERIGYWHEVHACPGGRKPIETLPLPDTAAISIP